MDYIRLINEFGNPKAKIDFITLALPATIRSERDAYYFGKRIKNPDSIKVAAKWRSSNDDWLTLHDPTLQDLQFLLDEHHDTEILSLEIASDFTLKDGSNDRARLVELHSWLKVCLFPQRHKRMQTGRRKFYEESDNSIGPDALKASSSDTSFYWADWTGREQVRLYIKEIDNKKPIAQHCVRLEVTLSRGGCQHAKVSRIGMLPGFIKGMRPYLSPFLNVAKGIKPEIKRTRSKNPTKALKAASNATKEQARVDRHWKCYGAAWAARHGYRIIPDAQTNRLIGNGLGRLQHSLGKLKLTRKVSKYPDYETA